MPEVTDQSLLRFVQLLTSAMDAGDPFTHGRAYHCSKYARRVGRHFALSEPELMDLELAALLQDLGKRLVLHETSRKAGPLNSDERSRMVTHASISARLLADLPFLRGASFLIGALNERWNGEGFPAGLRGEGIPLGSRILAAVSALDAMTWDRPYRAGLEPEQAYSELRREAGTRFDPAVVDALIALHESGDLLTEFDRNDALLFLSDVGDTVPELGPVGATGASGRAA